MTIVEISILIPNEFLDRFDKFLDELQSNNLIPPSSRQEARSDIICTAIESYMQQWLGIKEKRVEEKVEEYKQEPGNVYIKMAHSVFPHIPHLGER